MLKVSSGENDVPPCFGKYFDAKSAECVGGYDAAYYEDGTHTRPRCDFVSACSAKIQASKNATAHSLVPTSSLVRPPTHFNQPNAPITSTGYRPPGYVPQQAPHYWQHNAGVPQYGIPQYLTIREPISGQGLGLRLLTEAARSIGKSLGHTIAHFFDVEVFGGKPPGP